MKNKKVDWNSIKDIYPTGTIVKGMVIRHAPFGIFVDIGHSAIKGLVQITDFLNEGRMLDSMYPPIGSQITAVILAYTEDERNQIWLSMKPSSLRQAGINDL